MSDRVLTQDELQRLLDTMGWGDVTIGDAAARIAAHDEALRAALATAEAARKSAEEERDEARELLADACGYCWSYGALCSYCYRSNCDDNKTCAKAKARGAVVAAYRAAQAAKEK